MAIDQDKISKLQDWIDIGWIQVDFRPIKQILLSYSFKWMWTFARYLTDKVTDTLKSLDAFLKRTEPHIEGITGEERDTGFFMSMMRLFNESLSLNHYPELVTVSENVDDDWLDLLSFAERLNQLKDEIDVSDVYMRDCLLQNAYVRIKKFTKQVKSLQQEAKDLKELQELLEATIVDFATLNECQSTVRNLTLMWQAVEVIRKQQNGWKMQPWQVIDTAQLVQSTEEQLSLIKSLSRKVQGWDVYTGTMESVNVIQLTLPLIKDLLNPAMRTRHWKQLVRDTGGQLRVTPGTLRQMTLGDLLTLGLQKHTEHVKSIVERAVKDATVEGGLKNCEEVWMSRIFELCTHSTVTWENESTQILLLTNSNAIFEDLEHHQLALEAMKRNSEAGPFADEVGKWQRRLQVIEATLHRWLEVQEKWFQLEGVSF
ncbi:dynein axonemal heavy chain 11-like [Erpetoichthys calabaricus]|uniref:dynein axonemal heavy chain 11-like n=1 Tax=Erpetoichthys calabaricus TaxID=27687 RepID=UPI002233FF86|nr:dynein axonemal heavy chain 11-like [Erpetoichthys calabaricus]